jgi:hypothetical protein
VDGVQQTIRSLSSLFACLGAFVVGRVADALGWDGPKKLDAWCCTADVRGLLADLATRSASVKEGLEDANVKLARVPGWIRAKLSGMMHSVSGRAPRRRGARGRPAVEEPRAPRVASPARAGAHGIYTDASAGGAPARVRTRASRPCGGTASGGTARRRNSTA